MIAQNKDISELHWKKILCFGYEICWWQGSYLILETEEIWLTSPKEKVLPLCENFRKSTLKQLYNFSSKIMFAVAKSLQSCPTLCHPIDGSHQAPPSLGFFRQEHWSVLPFPSPVHESEKWKWSRSAVSDSSRPHELQPTRLLHPWDFPGKSTGVGCHCLLQWNHNKRSF